MLRPAGSLSHTIQTALELGDAGSFSSISEDEGVYGFGNNYSVTLDNSFQLIRNFKSVNCCFNGITNIFQTHKFRNRLIIFIFSSTLLKWIYLSYLFQNTKFRLHSLFPHSLFFLQKQAIFTDGMVLLLLYCYVKSWQYKMFGPSTFAVYGIIKGGSNTKL